MDDKTPLISVIVPVFNVENYIEKSVKALFNQSLKDIEIIFIDDKSTDNSLENLEKIISEYPEWQDKTTIIKHRENKGVSAARNSGLKEAHGEWIYFCDADDEVTEDGLKTLYSLVGTKTDLAAAFLNYIKEGKKLNTANYSHELKTFYPKKYCYYLLGKSDGNYQGYTHTKLFNNRIIKENNLKFNENIKYNEDRLFIFEYLTKINGQVNYKAIPVYNYFIRESGVMETKESREKYRNYETDLDAFIEMRSRGKKFRDNNLLKLIDLNILSSGERNKNLILKYSDNPEVDIKRINKKIKNSIGSFNKFQLEKTLKLKNFIKNLIQK